MNKRDLIDAVAETADITKKEAATALEATLDVIQTVVTAGDEVRISGFGVFDSAERPPRKGVNAFNGEPWSVPATRVPKFKAFDAFKAAVAKARRAAA
jgi:DNA-binding protein HU-beta